MAICSLFAEGDGSDKYNSILQKGSKSERYAIVKHLRGKHVE